MKKLLSIVISVILGVNVIDAATTVTAKATKEDKSSLGVGTVQVHMKTGWDWSTFSNWSSGQAGETSTHTSNERKPGYSASVISRVNGYYFYQWQDADGNRITEKNNSNDRDVKNLTASTDSQITIYAIFKPIDISPEVSYTFNPTKTSGLYGKSDGNVVFTITSPTDSENTYTLGDFEWEITGEGFEILDGGVTLSGTSVTIPIRFTDHNQHGVNEAEITLTSVGRHPDGSANSVTKKISINSDLTPIFTTQTPYEFKSDEAELEYKVPVNATVGSQSELYATNKNNVAAAVTGEWEAEVVNELTGDDKSAFTVVRLTNGEFVVNFKPTEAKTYTATLKTRVKYVDSKGQEIYSNYVSTRLSGTGKKTERSVITFNPLEWDFGQQPTGYTGNKQFSVTLENAANVTYSFGENLAEGFPFTYDASAEGYVTVIANAIAPGTYNATLTATGDNTIEGEAGNKITATLPVSIKVDLQSPLLQAGSNQTDLYYLTWNVVPYATSHAIYEVNGETKTDITTQVTWVTTEGNQLVVSIPSDGTAKSYIVKSSGKYKEETYEAWSNVVTANMSQILYFHAGPSVYVSGHEEMGGQVYVDNGAAGSVDNVTGWSQKLEDGNTYAQNSPDFSYTYYAKVADATKYAFKGWATTLHGEPAYTDNPLTITETMSDENTSVDVRFLTTPYYAVFESFYYKCPAVSVATPSRGSGKVFVSLTGASVDDCTQEDVIASTEVRQVPAAKENHGYRVYYYAKANDGANFVGWSTTADGLNIISTADTYSTMYYSTNKSKDLPHVAAPLYAVFRSDIDVRQQDRMIVYIDDEGNGNINDAKVLVNFQKGTKLKATLDGGDASLFTLSNRSGSKSGTSVTFDATQGMVELVVAYTGDLATAKGKEAKIKLTATYFDNHEVYRPISIIVEEAPVITFLPTDGKGEYTIKMTNGSGVNYKMTSANTEYIKVPVTHESMSNIEMNLTQDAINDGYYFFAWQMIDGEEKRYLSYEQLCNYQFTKSVKVRPEFIHSSIATYRIANDASNTPYYDFAAAMNDAEKLYKANGSYQFVILNDKRLSDDGKKTTINVRTAVLPKGKYTIPNGVRLVIPRNGSSDFKSNLTTEDYYQGAPNGKEHIRWIVEEGTTIDVNGNAIICVLARVACQGGLLPNGVPMDYGHIELRENCCITFNNSAKCYAYGYITGPFSSSVVMKKGTEVKELMQIQDWPGGTKMASYYLLGTKKVFPISQYYIQNVEAPLVLEKGAKETLHAAIAVSGITAFDFDFVGANTGFFRIGEGSFTKAYDPTTDRMKFTTKPDATTGKGSFTLGNIAFSVNIGVTANIDSKDYVLPLIHSYDFILGAGTETTVLYDAALLPSATMYIEQGAELTVSSSSNIYVYGKEYATINGVGYYGNASKLLPAYGRPGTMFKRTVEMLEDAKVMVDGQVSLDGKLYTTSGTDDPKYANITSNGGGKVTYNQIGSSSANTYQLAAQEATAIPVVPARLKNEDTSSGQYTTPAKGNTYTYVDKKWQVTSATSDPTIPAEISYVPTFTTSDYSTSAYVGGKESVGSITIATNNSDIDWSKVTWGEPVIEGEHADQFEFAFDDKGPQGKVTFNPESDGIKTATLRITATYKPTIQMGSKSVTVTYTYSQDIHLTGNAIYLAANTLSFADLSAVYEEKTDIALLKEKNSDGQITVKVEDNTGEISFNGETGNQTFVMDYSSQNSFNALKEGKVTITVTQDADLTKNIAATTITTTVEVTKRVIWNWDILYFGTVNKDPVTVLDASTGWSIVEKTDTSNIINFAGTAPDYTATIEDQIAGEYGATFTFTQGKYTEDFNSVVIPNPQHLRVDVNSETVFRAVTLSANENVSFYTNQEKPDESGIKFQSSASNISQWKMTFIGVPDKVYFRPTGGNAWQIEESANGVNWTTSFPWKSIAKNSDFEMSLQPSTRYLRISYGAGSTVPAILRDFYIAELAHVKSDVEKIYVPIEFDGANIQSVTNEVVLTYANTAQLGIRVSNADHFLIRKSGTADELTDALSIPATTELTPFGITGIEVELVGYEQDAQEYPQEYLNVYEGSNLVLQIPIQPYQFPQDLPIKLATDKPDGGDRYYYVTTRTHNAEWSGADRIITLNNAVSDAAPEVTFVFNGAPTYIHFKCNIMTNDANPLLQRSWEIEEYTPDANGEYAWRTTLHNAEAGDILTATEVKRAVSPTASSIRLIYQSPYAEKVQISELVIVGDASAVVDPARMELDDEVPQNLTIHTINLPSMTIKSSNPNFKIALPGTTNYAQSQTLDAANYEGLGNNKIGEIIVPVQWTYVDKIVEYATLTLEYDNKVLATVELIGQKGQLTEDEIETGIHTGIPEGYDLMGSFEDEAKRHRKVNISAAFSNATTPTALFDYVVIYGETTTNDGTTTITTPNSIRGSNAKTPIYIYKKNGTRYEFFKQIENANTKVKAWNVTTEDDADAIVPATTTLSMYITGFCPYASTGYTKADEGVWYFKGDAGDEFDIYLEDCYLYSRYKTDDGHSFADRNDGYSFVEPYVRGSGAVLVFACNDKDNLNNPMKVTIHTLDRNILKSHYGCFLQSVAGRAFQASSPVQIRVINDKYVKTTTTTLNFTDEWPASLNTLTCKRTNGFLSLQKQVNNAPSIDMGAPYTTVNFNGGQVELQNAQIVSPNYKSSLAICPRAGTFAGILLAYGMGTDDVGGTVNFIDGTTTVMPMYVSPDYAESYLLDKDAEGNYITNDKGEYRTSCLRTPAKTFVSGGSHCMMRACSDPESQGGAPKNKPGDDGVLLGLYKYPRLDPNPADATNKTPNWGWDDIKGGNGLVTPKSVPKGYGILSVTPNTNGTSDPKDDYLNFWFDPAFESTVTPEIDKQISFWKTCMTLIEAQYAGEGGSVGGDATVKFEGKEQMELIKYLLYCKIDEHILEEISKGDYQAPVKNPAPEGGNYLPIHPSKVGDQTQHFFTNNESFQVEGKLYYITTATADVWNAFTAPFDVANIYIMETYPENELEKLEYREGKKRTDILKVQAKHNADFASFFGVTIALKQNKVFETIYSEYMAWADAQDKELELTQKTGYTRRGKRLLVPYNGDNWATADFYLNENLTTDDKKAPWALIDAENDMFQTTWRYPDASDGILLHQGVTYSMLLPFCTGCAEVDDKGSTIQREFWDYWSGKFLIFESTEGTAAHPHVVQGKSILDEDNEKGIFANQQTEEGALLMGNSTLAEMQTTNDELYTYSGDIKQSTFRPIELVDDEFDGPIAASIAPTESFLIPKFPKGVRAKGITLEGNIIYDDTNSNQNGTTGGRIPTVGGGNDLFITSIAGGINVAVAAPQNIRVLSSTGAVIYSGFVQTAVDITLPANGIYIVSGENEVQKILF